MFNYRLIQRVLCLAVCAMMCASVAHAQEKKLVVWSHWVDEPVKKNFVHAVAEAFEKETGIKVEVVWMKKYDLREKLELAYEKPEPDISYIDYEFNRPRVLGLLLPLDGLTFAGKLDPSWKLGNVGQKDNNFLPIEGAASAMYYNKELFQKANITLPGDRPVTTDEFLAILNALRAAGITPIGEGGTDADFKYGLPIINMMLRYAGADKIGQLFKGEIDFSDPDIQGALTFWKQVVDARWYDNETLLKLSLSDGIFEMTDGKAAINFCGTWIYGKYATTERDRNQIGVLDWPTPKDGKGNSVYEIQWPAGYGINKYSPRVEDAKKFLEFLMTPQAAELWVRHVQSPYPVVDVTIPSDTLYSVLAEQRKQSQPIIQAFSFEAGFGDKGSDKMWLVTTQKFLMGELSVEELVESMNSRLLRR